MKPLYLALMAAADAIPLAHARAREGVSFTPVIGQPWMRYAHLPAALGLKNHGILQIDINRPDGAGAGDLISDVGAVLAHFAERKRFSSGGAAFFVHHRSASPVRSDDGWQVVSVSIHYRSAS